MSVRGATDPGGTIILATRTVNRPSIHRSLQLDCRREPGLPVVSTVHCGRATTRAILAEYPSYQSLPYRPGVKRRAGTYEAEGRSKPPVERCRVR